VKKLVGRLVAFAERFGVDLPELFHFGLVGGANTVLSYGVYSLLLLLGAPYYVALVFDYVFAICFSLFANKEYTFKTADSVGMDTFLKMAGSYFTLFVVNEGVLYLAIKALTADPFLAQACATVLIALLSFFLQKFFVFRRKKGARNLELQSPPVEPK
jgi:putative flippase GtrA